MACRNLVQLALEGYFDRTVFHRLVPGFMVQGGDPTRTGEGGDSVWGKPFRDEFNARLRFNHRGQLAMANENRPDTNRAQWFFTLDECRWLDGKHTIFGTVAGDTVFNLLRMGEAEVVDDRPVEDIVLKTIEVLVNPFEDVVPRHLNSPSPPPLRNNKKPPVAKKQDLKLLSFADEDNEETTGFQARTDKVVPAPPSSSLVGYAQSDDDDESQQSSPPPPPPSQSPPHSQRREQPKRVFDRDADASNFAASMAAKVKERMARLKKRSKTTTTTRDDARLAELKAEASTAQKKLLRAAPTIAVNETESSRPPAAPAPPSIDASSAHPLLRTSKTTTASSLLSANERLRLDTKRKKANSKDREDDTLARLERFSSNLKSTKTKATPEVRQATNYDGKVLEDDDDDGNDTDWFVGRLTFKKHTDDLFKKSGGDGRDANDYILVDDRATKKTR